VKSVVDFTVKTYGTVDILVNNAQVFKNFTPILEHTDDDIYKVFNSGYMGSLWFMKECFPYMKEHGGKIINTASEAGIEGKKDFLAYASTKEAIRAMSRVAAREWGQYRINVNIICPLALSDTMRHEAPSEELAAMTAQIPIGLLGGPEAIAPIAVFLASSDADYLTGYTLFADGGHCMDTAR
jgi:NAD(P)-dependent dehydrogenase (short-subunit alcohol dehydrogenase family)